MTRDNSDNREGFELEELEKVSESVNQESSARQRKDEQNIKDELELDWYREYHSWNKEMAADRAMAGGNW